MNRFRAVAALTPIVLVALAGDLRPAEHSNVPAARADGAVVRHRLQVTLTPATWRIRVIDRVTVPASDGPLPDFVLNARLRILTATPALDEVPVGGVRALWDTGGRGESVKHYRVRTPAVDRTLTIQYEGALNFGLSSEQDEYTRGFRATRGIVSPQGVYLAGDTAWYPQFHTTRLEFTMEAKSAADGWHLVSQGSGTSRDAGGVARWNSPEPMEEIYLVGGPLVVFSQRAGPVDVFVYLHRREPLLAGRYLTTGGQYLAMYARLIGAYPYDKFALIENFWETGFGMPSFTLLGPQVIRFPFILHSSFPHEILHNWWANSVFVDYASGNWCEGLTAYLSDHLVQEQNGQGAASRRDTLQRYRDYVKEGRDFPLVDFRARDSAATEAVGYGKAMMVFHMLRRALGDDAFTGLLRHLYAGYRGRQASWKDVQREAESAGGRSFGAFFTEWLTRAGAPALQVHDVSVKAGDGGYRITGTIAQVQPGRPYQLRIPVVVQTSADVQRREVVMDGASAAFEVASALRPIALYVDPYFDVFRLLDVRETPPSVGQIFGEPRVLAVLPAGAPPALVAAYRSLVESWRSESHAIEVKLDSEVDVLPADRSVWLLGADNRFATVVFHRNVATATGPAPAARGATAASSTWTTVLVGRHPSNSEKAIALIVSDSAAPLSALGRKLPHYGKYSYLTFQGNDATNRTAAQSAELDSPLRVDLRTPLERRQGLPPLPADPARALARLPE